MIYWQKTLQVHVDQLRPSSVGWIKLDSADPRKHPLINPNYLSTEQDRSELNQISNLKYYPFFHRSLALRALYDLSIIENSVLLFSDLKYFQTRAASVCQTDPRYSLPGWVRWVPGPGDFSRAERSVRRADWCLRQVSNTLFQIVIKWVVHSVATPVLLCHKEPAQGTQSPLLGALGLNASY